MTIKEAVDLARHDLQKIYEEGEAAAITRLLLESITGEDPATRLPIKEKPLTEGQEIALKKSINRLLLHEPLQYVIHEAWFCGLKFYVNKDVLIPRPETEELVEWVITNCKFPLHQLSILDIGTGSGCIAISLKRKLRKADVSGCDISEAALAVARKNAADLGVAAAFFQHDILDEVKNEQLKSYDIIISNPPYIPEKDKSSIQPNVLNYEPHMALFVPDKDALLFYRSIALFGKKHLNTGGTIYAEMHKEMGKAVADLFEKEGYDTQTRKDMQGIERMLKAVLKQ